MTSWAPSASRGLLPSGAASPPAASRSVAQARLAASCRQSLWGAESVGSVLLATSLWLATSPPSGCPNQKAAAAGACLLLPGEHEIVSLLLEHGHEPIGRVHVLQKQRR